MQEWLVNDEQAEGMVVALRSHQQDANQELQMVRLEWM
jgi:hypothetical protein